MKSYTMSDMDSECDDVFTDDSKGPSLPDENGCHMINRKRRRGIIEKRRRDRINSSLSELRRLVPAAFEKQGSAKLEKAEILQMTVDHMKILHTKGVDPFGFETNQFVMDYHNIGFRECAAEVARYLVGMEGMDLQDPLRMRLLSHLQCFAAQRDLAVKSSSWSPLFSSMAVTPASQYTSGALASGTLSDRTSSTYSGDYGSSGSETRLSHSSTTIASPVARSPVSRLSPMTSSPLTSSQFRDPATYGAGYPSNSGNQRVPVRPYRPWGTELAY